MPRGSRSVSDSSSSFAFSACLHSAVLTWLVLASHGLNGEKPPSPYDREIRPHEARLVWYSLRNRLPNVKPGAVKARALPPRAVRRFDQQIVAGPKETASAPQLIRAPEPKIVLPKPLPLPNFLAVSQLPPRPVKRFVPPPDHVVPRPAPALPQAPNLDSRPRIGALAMKLDPSRPKPLPFVAPAMREKRTPALELPQAPAIAPLPPAAEMPRLPKGFQPPPERARKTEPAVTLAEEPSAPAAVRASPQADLVIAGLNPARLLDIPKLPGAHDSGFSGGPRPRPEGAAATPNDAKVTVPDLSAHAGEHDAEPTLVAGLGPNPRKALLDALRPGGSIVGMTASVSPVHAARVVGVPDARLAGRATYSMAIQMPNLTSYSGSWLVWFAEREAGKGHTPENILAPAPLRLVDPKYVRTAAEERVEGTVRLFGVIRKDGSVDSVELLRRLDPRLDAAAAEALSKWKFTPALRDGAPVEVDAVFEVPFHLAPKTAQ
ncbi:MAG: TonB family protein [Bryobacteraceae bacterium]